MPRLSNLETKTTKIINENLLKLDNIQNLASATSKMTSHLGRGSVFFFKRNNGNSGRDRKNIYNDFKRFQIVVINNSFVDSKYNPLEST